MTQVHLLFGQPEQAARHLIFVHGLKGHWRSTWGDNPDRFWPNWLGNDVQGAVAVWSIEYDAPFSRWKNDSMELAQRGMNVASAIMAEPHLVNGQCAFIAHSLGGLVVKQAIRYLEGSRPTNRRAAKLITCVDKVVFLATPHFGARLASWGQRLAAIVRPSGATVSLTLNDPHLADLNSWYKNFVYRQSIENVILSETKRQKIFLGYKAEIVAANSVDAGIFGTDPIPIDSDHENICKIVSKDDLAYKVIVQFLNNVDYQPIIGFEGLDRIADRVERALPYFVQALRSKGINISIIEGEVAKLAALEKDVTRVSTEAEGLDPAVVRYVEATATEEDGSVENISSYADPVSADRRLVISATQALAIAEAGYRRQDAAMMTRGINRASQCIEALQTEDESRAFLRENLEGLRVRRNSLDLTT